MKRITCFAFTIAAFAVTLFSVAGASAQAQTTPTTTAPDQSSFGGLCPQSAQRSGCENKAQGRL